MLQRRANRQIIGTAIIILTGISSVFGYCDPFSSDFQICTQLENINSKLQQQIQQNQYQHIKQETNNIYDRMREESNVRPQIYINKGCTNNAYRDDDGNCYCREGFKVQNGSCVETEERICSREFPGTIFDFPFMSIDGAIALLSKEDGDGSIPKTCVCPNGAPMSYDPVLKRCPTKEELEEINIYGKIPTGFKAIYIEPKLNEVENNFWHGLQNKLSSWLTLFRQKLFGIKK